jgi:hypothetical protein
MVCYARPASRFAAFLIVALVVCGHRRRGPGRRGRRGRRRGARPGRLRLDPPPASRGRRLRDLPVPLPARHDRPAATPLAGDHRQPSRADPSPPGVVRPPGTCAAADTRHPARRGCWGRWGRWGCAPLARPALAPRPWAAGAGPLARVARCLWWLRQPAQSGVCGSGNLHTMVFRVPQPYISGFSHVPQGSLRHRRVRIGCRVAIVSREHVTLTSGLDLPSAGSILRGKHMRSAHDG